MTRKTTTRPAKAGPKSRCYYGLVPWKCVNLAERSEIIAYVEASGRWETVAVVPPTSGTGAEELAAFITRVVNATLQNRDLLQDAMKALEAVVQEGLNYSTEQEADSVATSIKRVIS